MTRDISHNKGIPSYTYAKKRELVTNIVFFYLAHGTHTHTHTHTQDNTKDSIHIGLR